jgi:hypothetical protein
MLGHQQSQQTIVRVNQGYYSTKIFLNSLSIQQQPDLFSKQFTVALTGTNTNKIKLLSPGSWTTQIAASRTVVYAGALSTNYGGSFILDTFKTLSSDTSYVQVPPLLNFIVSS